MAELDKALELDPNFFPAHLNRIDVYLAKSMFKEALAEMEWALPFLSTALDRFGKQMSDLIMQGWGGLKRRSRSCGNAKRLLLMNVLKM